MATLAPVLTMLIW